MKRMHIVGAALVALFAFSVFATAASATTFLLAEWLINGTGVTANLLVESTASALLLLGLNGLGIGVKTTVSCSGTFDGYVGPDGLDFNSELLNLAKEVISTTNLVGLALECTNVSECPTPLVWPDGIPGQTLAVLMEQGTEKFFVDLLFNAGWYIECNTIFGKIAELCEAPETAVQLTNEPNGTVDATFTDAFQVLAGLVLATCGENHTEAAEVEGLGIITPDEGSLEISSEP